MSNRPDLYAFFDAMDKGDFDYIDSMTDEEIKNVSPFVMLMWVHGATTNTVEHVLLTNAYCNQYVFGLSKHPRLLLKLLISANMGLGNRFKFKKSTQVRDTKHLKMIQDWYECGFDESKQIKELLSKKDLKQLEDFYEQ